MRILKKVLPFVALVGLISYYFHLKKEIELEEAAIEGGRNLVTEFSLFMDSINLVYSDSIQAIRVQNADLENQIKSLRKKDNETY